MGEASGGEKAHLPQPLGGVGGLLAEALLPHGSSPVELGRTQHLQGGRRLIGRHAMHREFLPDTGHAEAIAPAVDQGLGEALVGKEIARHQPIENRVEIGFGGRKWLEPTAQLETAEFATRKQRERPRLK